MFLGTKRGYIFRADEDKMVLRPQAVAKLRKSIGWVILNGYTLLKGESHVNRLEHGSHV